MTIPLIYLFISILLSLITVKQLSKNKKLEKTIYLSSNGVHLDILIPKENIQNKLLNNLYYKNNDTYFAFGWGEENFYLNTPSWRDISILNSIKALFLKNKTLIHVTRYQQKRSTWIEIKISTIALKKLNNYLYNSFQKNKYGSTIILKNKSYSNKDNFYHAKGRYSCFKTCNSWVNSAFKESGLKSCFWTPFDIGLTSKYN